jgi:Kef-type K+ transport system membrane component KefB
MGVFIEMSVILAATIAIAGILRVLKQPLIIGYILTGIAVGPTFLNLVRSTETISVFAHIGIALLLFTVGLGIDPKIIKYVGKVSLIAGLGQVIFTSLIGFFIALALGFSVVSSIYIAVALTFSSTIIIMKLLSDKGDTETLYGKISIGILLVQDLIVILVLMGVSSLTNDFTITTLAYTFLVKGVGLLGIILVVSSYLLPRMIKHIAQSQEFLLLISIGWCLALASLTYYLDFSIEIGALLAGITLAASPYRHSITAKMSPLRDFFVVLFFILLGSQMVFTDISQYTMPIIIFSLFILIGNPLIVVAIMGFLGYTKRNSFLTGLTVAQISEFSLIFISLGVQVGHLDNEILSLVTVIGLITIAGSTYLILHADTIYPYFSHMLRLFERKGKKTDNYNYAQGKTHNVILFGYDRMGLDVLQAFQDMQSATMVVDHNPEVIEHLMKLKINCRFGDAGDDELLEELHLSTIQMAVSTIPKADINLMLVHMIRLVNSQAVVIVASQQIDDALQLYKAGATYVLMSDFISGYHASVMIKKNEYSVGKFELIKERHIKFLHKRKKTAY